MYVAFRWLTALSLAMWLGLCCIHLYLTQYKASIFLSTAVTPYKLYEYTNDTIFKELGINKITENRNPRKKIKHHRMAYLHYATFLAGAIAVFMYNKKSSVVTHWRSKVKIAWKNFDSHNSLLGMGNHASVAMLQYWRLLQEKLRNYISIAKPSENGQHTNLSLLKRLKDVVQERKALGQVLMAVIEENKNIRQLCQLETNAKNRLLRYVQDTQDMMKENKSRYVDFKQLYLTTAKENCYLKSSIKTLKKEKDEAEKKLLQLINIVYRSRNNDLKAYCTRFLVHTKNNLLNSNVNAEIRKFLQKSQPLVTVIEDNSIFNSDTTTPQVTEILEDEGNVERFASSGPKLRGLPGEYVWTAKNKDGIIEKLYEYDCETDTDNGDTIQRIREYSVYHDKDSFLDQSNLAANLPTCPSLSASATRLRLDIKSFSSQGFLSKILVKNIPLRLPSTAEAPPLPFTVFDL